MEDPHYSYADICMSVGGFAMRTVVHNTKTAPGVKVIAREYVYPESGEPQTVYFVRVEGAPSAVKGTSQQDTARATESSRDDVCVLSSERGDRNNHVRVPEGGVEGGGGDIEAPRQWEDSSDDNDDYHNSLFAASGGSGSSDDSSSSGNWEEFGRVGRCGVDWMTGGLESDDLGGSEGGSSSAEPPAVLDGPGGEIVGGWSGMSGNCSLSAHGRDAGGVCQWVGDSAKHNSSHSSSSDSSLSDLDAQIHVCDGVEDEQGGRHNCDADTGRRRDIFEVSCDSDSA